MVETNYFNLGICLGILILALIIIMWLFPGKD